MICFRRDICVFAYRHILLATSVNVFLRRRVDIPPPSKLPLSINLERMMPIKKEDMGNLGPEEMRVLRNLHKIQKFSNKKNPISKVEQKECAQYLSSILGNISYNKKIGVALKQNMNLTEAEKTLLEDLRYLSYKTQEHELSDLLKRAKNNLEQLKKGREIPEHERLTLPEIGKIRGLTDVYGALLDFSRTGMIKQDSTLEGVYELSYSADVLMKEINEILSNARHFKAGDILMFGFDKEMMLKSKTLNREQSLTKSLVSDFSHAAQLFQKDEKLKLSHVEGDYETWDLDLSNSSYEVHPKSRSRS